MDMLETRRSQRHRFLHAPPRLAALQLRAATETGEVSQSTVPAPHCQQGSSPAKGTQGAEDGCLPVQTLWRDRALDIPQPAIRAPTSAILLAASGPFVPE
jgi:hypothetical protein